MEIDIRNLCYGLYVDGFSRKSYKQILYNINVNLQPKVLCALLGPSGVGKSTLLDLIADRTLVGEWSGDILFAGNQRPLSFQRDCAYIIQSDLHVSTLTVRESIYFATSLKMPEGTPQVEINERVQSILTMTGLERVQHCLVGDGSYKGISGGELKRLSIATEIVSMPKILLLDEPTSGLDSKIAIDIMTMLKAIITDGNVTCMATIHQPSPLILATFDQIVLLSKGRVIYAGNTQDVLTYFTSSPLHYSYSLGNNPAEFILLIAEGKVTSQLQVVQGGNKGPNSDSKPRDAKELEALYYQTQLASNNKTSLLSNNHTSDYKPSSLGGSLLSLHYWQALHSATFPSTTSSSSSSTLLHTTTMRTQFRYLTWRMLVSMKRDYLKILMNLLKNLLVGMLVGFIFYEVGLVTVPLFGSWHLPKDEVLNVSAVLFFTIIYSTISIVEVIGTIFHQQLIFRREIGSGLYQILPYWLVQSLAILPVLFVGYMIFATCVYLLVYFRRTWQYYLYYTSIGFLAMVYSYYLAMIVAYISRKISDAIMIYTSIFLFVTAFGGFLITLKNIPTWWTWVTKINYVRWCYEGLMINEWKYYDALPKSKGSVLALYDFTTETTGYYNRYYTYPIMLAFIAVNLLCLYLVMLPTRKYLQHVTMVGEDGILQRVTNIIFLPWAAWTGGDRSEEEGKDLSQQAVDKEERREGRRIAGKDYGTMKKKETTLSQLNQANSNHGDHHNTQSNGKGITLSFQNISCRISRSNRVHRTDGTSATNARPATVEEDDTTPFLREEEGQGSPTTVEERPSSNQSKHDHNSKHLTILHEVSGRAEPGEILAILGSSGAGKSSLIDILAGRKSVGEIQGEIFWNGVPFSPGGSLSLPGSDHFLKKNLIAYVMQDNLHIPQLTVRETLSFAAKLRMPYLLLLGRSEQQQQQVVSNGNQTASISYSSMINDRVQELLQLLNLENVQHSYVGDDHLRGISGGQKKRLSIGVEIIHQPSIIFLDEPTTGLDSVIAYEVMSIVKENLAGQRNSTIICTIHQPGRQIYDLFDKVLVLSAGHMIYFGPSQDMLSYFYSLSDSLSTTNKSDYHLPTVESVTAGIQFFLHHADNTNRKDNKITDGKDPDPKDYVNPAEYAVAIAACCRCSSKNDSSSNDNDDKPRVEQLVLHYQESRIYQEEIKLHWIQETSNNRSWSSFAAGAFTFNSGTASSSSPFPESKLYDHEHINATADNSSYSSPVNKKHENNDSWYHLLVKAWQIEIFRTYICFHRLCIEKMREKFSVLLNILRHVLVGLFLGSLFYHLTTVLSIAEYLNRLSLLFFCLIFIISTHLADVTEMIEGRLIFYRERSAGVMSTTSTLLARMIFHLPINLFCVYLFVKCLYHLSALRSTSPNYFQWFWYVLVLTDLIGYFTAVIVAAVAPNQETAMSIFPIFFGLAAAFGGYIVFIPNYPLWLQWGTKISYFRYAYQALILNELDENDDLAYNYYFVDLLGFEYITKEKCVHYLWIIVFIHVILAFLAYKFVHYEKR